MPGFLRQSTASQSRALGPFVSDSDFKTVQTGLTIANTDIKLIVNGAASANKNSGGGTHRANGVYGVTFDATDSATVGEMEVSVSVSGALVVFDKFFVIEEAVFDALFAASAPGYLQPVTAGRQLVVDASGLADANAVKVGPSGSGTAQTAGDIVGYIDTEVAAIKAKTDLIPASPAAVGDIPTAAQNADALLDRSNAIETGLTPRGALRLNSAALAGKLSGAAGTTVTIRNSVADSKDRIVATVDSSGNRTAITTDVT